MEQQECGLITVSLDQVPLYLQEGEYFQSLNSSADGVIQVPANVMKSDPHIGDVKDLSHLLHSLQFWIACKEERIAEIVDHLLSVGVNDKILGVIDDFEVLFPFLHILRIILQSEDVSPRPGSTLVPLSNYVRECHSCSVDILLHLSAHEFVLATFSSHADKTEKDKTLHEFIAKYNVRTVARDGAFALLKSLFEHGISDSWLCKEAAQKGNLDCLRYLVEQGCEPRLETSIVAAINGYLHVLQYLHSTGNLHNCSNFAARGGHLHCLEFWHSIGAKWSVSVPSNAAHNGHLACLTYLHENGCQWDEYTCSRAAEGGHLSCLEYAHNNGCPWNETTCSAAAEGGHMNCLLYARSHGCPWDATTCAKAACGGHLSILQYAHENGCPWDKETRRAAETQGHVDCLKYATSHGAPAHRKRRRKD